MGNKTSDSLVQYSKDIENSAKKKESHLYHNEGNQHALIVFTNMFRYSNEEVRLAANQLYNDQLVNTTEYIDSVQTFLNKDNTRLYVIVSNPPSKGTVNKTGTFYGMLCQHQAYKEGRVIIKDGQGKSFKTHEGDRVNFCVCDTSFYRYEDNIEQRTAIVDFGDTDTASELKSKFDNIFKVLPTLNISDLLQNE